MKQNLSSDSQKVNNELNKLNSIEKSIVKLGKDLKNLSWEVHDIKSMLAHKFVPKSSTEKDLKTYYKSVEEECYFEDKKLLLKDFLINVLENFKIELMIYTDEIPGKKI